MAAPKISLSLGASRPSASRSTPAQSRQHALLADDEDAEEDGQNQNAISEFGVSTLNNEAKTETERVIRSLPNRDWQEDMRRRRQRSGLPVQEQIDTTARSSADVVEASRNYGLTFRQRSQSPAAREWTTNETEVRRDDPENPRTVDDEALDALTGRERTQQTIIRPDSPQNEDEAFRTQFAEAPEVATLDDYLATPVEGFGAAILRGYLAPGETLESRMEKGRSNDRKMERRPGLLGIGAKDGGLGVELGAWGSGKSGKRGKDETTYNPLARRNMKTGETLTEDELKKKLEQQDLVRDTTNGDRTDRNGHGRRDGRRKQETNDDSEKPQNRSSSRRERGRDYYNSRDDTHRRRERRRDSDDDRSHRRERSPSRERRRHHDRDKDDARRREGGSSSYRSRDDERHDSGRHRHGHRRRER